jgi:hypothetical protein
MGKRQLHLTTNLGLTAGQTQVPPRTVSIRLYFGWGLSYLSRKCVQCPVDECSPHEIANRVHETPSGLAPALQRPN